MTSTPEPPSTEAQTQTPAFTTDPSFTDRRVSLADGRPGLRGSIAVETREVPGDSPAVLDFIASDETLDRFDEILLVDGWRLESYRRNPVFQNAHQYGDILFTLGRALLTEVRTLPSGARALFQRVEFATGINPLARIAYDLYRGKFLNAVSVGFIPLRWENGAPGAAFRRKYLEQELLEVSAVSIPANPNALQLGLQAGAVDRSDFRELHGLLLQLHSQSHNFRDRDTSHDAHLLRLARAISLSLKRV